MNPWRALAGLPRAMWVLFAATLVNRAGWMVMPFLTLYLTRSLGRTTEEAGVVLAVYGGVSLATSPVAGALSDRYGAPLLMRASLFLSGAVLLAFPLAKSYAAVLVAAGVLSFAHELFRPANLAVISEMASEAQRGPAFAAIRLAQNLGMSIGPAVGGFLSAESFSLLFLVDGVTTLATGLVLLFAFRPEKTGAREGSQAHRSTQAGASGLGAWRALAALGDRRLALFLAAVALTTLVFFQHYSTVPLYMMRDLGLSERIYGLTFTVCTALMVVLQVPLTAATARWPYRRSLALGALLCGIGFGATGLVESAAGLLATVVVWTFAEMLLLPTMSAYVAAIAPADRRGAYMGLFSMMFNLSFSVAPWLGGTVLARWGGGALWGGCFGVSVLAAVMMARVKEAPQGEAGRAAGA